VIKSLTSKLFHLQINQMNMTITQLDQLKRNYAEMIVEGMDMKLLIEFAEDSIVENLKGYEMEDLKEEISDCYGEEVWDDMTSS